MISLGSLLDLSTFFPVPPTCHLHIVDAHRPWNLQNLFGVDFDHSETVFDEDEEVPVGPGKIWVWGDGEEAALNNVKKSWEALEVRSARLWKYADASSTRQSQTQTRTLTVIATKRATKRMKKTKIRTRRRKARTLKRSWTRRGILFLERRANDQEKRPMGNRPAPGKRSGGRTTRMGIQPKCVCLLLQSSH